MRVQEIWKCIHPRVAYSPRALPSGNMILLGEYIFIFPSPACNKYIISYPLRRSLFVFFRFRLSDYPLGIFQLQSRYRLQSRQVNIFVNKLKQLESIIQQHKNYNCKNNRSVFFKHLFKSFLPIKFLFTSCANYVFIIVWRGLLMLSDTILQKVLLLCSVNCICMQIIQSSNQTGDIE